MSSMHTSSPRLPTCLLCTRLHVCLLAFYAHFSTSACLFAQLPSHNHVLSGIHTYLSACLHVYRSVPTATFTYLLGVPLCLIACPLICTSVRQPGMHIDLSNRCIHMYLPECLHLCLSIHMTCKHTQFITRPRACLLLIWTSFRLLVGLCTYNSTPACQPASLSVCLNACMPVWYRYLFISTYTHLPVVPAVPYVCLLPWYTNQSVCFHICLHLLASA